MQKSKSGKELGLVEVNAPIYPVDTKHTFPPGEIKMTLNLPFITTILEILEGFRILPNI